MKIYFIIKINWNLFIFTNFNLNILNLGVMLNIHFFMHLSTQSTKFNRVIAFHVGLIKISHAYL